MQSGLRSTYIRNFHLLCPHSLQIVAPWKFYCLPGIELVQMLSLQLLQREAFRSLREVGLCSISGNCSSHKRLLIFVYYVNVSAGSGHSMLPYFEHFYFYFLPSLLLPHYFHGGVGSGSRNLQQIVEEKFATFSTAVTLFPAGVREELAGVRVIEEEVSCLVARQSHKLL